MSHFELEPFGREPDGHEGFPNSYKVYDTFRGRVFVGTILYMTKLKVFRSASVYAPAEDIREAFNGSILDTNSWKGDVPYKDTNPSTEARKLYKLYLSKLNWRERIARTFDIWWPGSIVPSSVIVAISSTPVGILATIEIIAKCFQKSN